MGTLPICTIHVAKFEWMFPGPQVMKALKASDSIALELDVLDPDIQSRMARGMGAMQAVALPASLEKRMRQQADAICVSYDTISGLVPELQVTALNMYVGREAGLEASYAIDSVLAGIGHRSNKKMMSLETPEMQLKLLQMTNQQVTISFVEESLDELETGRSLKMLETISQLWADADYSRMEHYEDWCECLNTENEREVMKRVLDDRNPLLEKNIDMLHSSGKKVFAAVGSLHMFGTVGLPLLMEKKGYKVERVYFQ